MDVALPQARLLLDRPASGPRNMAVDEALLESAAASGQTTLRIYGWSPATLSLGYFQPASERELHPASRACPLVRRASGGGAILHDREVTYSLALPCSDRFGKQAADVYRRVHQSLIETIATWGIQAHRVGDLATASEGDESFLCFSRRSSEDIVVAGAKIVGSAQRRHHGALLQHGSILLARSQFAPELPGLSEAANLPALITFADFIARWQPILARTLQLDVVASELTAEETLAARRWEQERFATDEWNLKR